MGFADLSLADIATEYSLSVETVFALCDRLGINYEDENTCLALEDAKAVMMKILSQRQGNTRSSKIN